MHEISLVDCNIFLGHRECTLCVHSMFSCVRPSHGMCAHAHARSLEGTVVSFCAILWGCLATSFLNLLFMLTCARFVTNISLGCKK